MPILLLATFLLVFAQASEGRASLAFVVGAAFLLQLALLQYARRRSGSVAIKLTVAAFIIQSAWLLVVAINPTAQTGPYYHGFPVDLIDKPSAVFLALVLLPAGAMVAEVLLSKRSNPEFLSPLMPSRWSGNIVLHKLLCGAAILLVTYWPAAGAEADQSSAYFVRVAVANLQAIPWVAGVCSRYSPTVRNFWTIGLLLNTILGIAAGSRFYALMPLLLFLIGRQFAAPSRSQIRGYMTTTAMAAGVLILAAALGTARQDSGAREGLNWRSVLTATSSGTAWERQLVWAGMWENSVGRLIAWSNFVIPVLTPTEIPYRGLHDMAEELQSNFTIARIAGVSRDDLVERRTDAAAAAEYGFRVDAGTSVEFGVVAEMWSRGGPLFVFFAGILMAGMFIALERAAVIAARHSLPLGIFLMGVVAQAAFTDVLSVPSLTLTRGLLLGVLYITICVSASTGLLTLLPVATGKPPRRSGVRRLPGVGQSASISAPPASVHATEGSHAKRL